MLLMNLNVDENELQSKIHKIIASSINKESLINEQGLGEMASSQKLVETHDTGIKLSDLFNIKDSSPELYDSERMTSNRTEIMQNRAMSESDICTFNPEYTGNKENSEKKSALLKAEFLKSLAIAIKQFRSNMLNLFASVMMFSDNFENEYIEFMICKQEGIADEYCHSSIDRVRNTIKVISSKFTEIKFDLERSFESYANKNYEFNQKICMGPSKCCYNCNSSKIEEENVRLKNIINENNVTISSHETLIKDLFQKNKLLQAKLIKYKNIAESNAQAQSSSLYKK